MRPDPAMARIVRAARAEAAPCPRCGKARQVSAREEPQPKGPAVIVVTGRCSCTPGDRSRR